MSQRTFIDGLGDSLRFRLLDLMSRCCTEVEENDSVLMPVDLQMEFLAMGMEEDFADAVWEELVDRREAGTLDVVRRNIEREYKEVIN